jgi:hypothetical protein
MLSKKEWNFTFPMLYSLDPPSPHFTKQPLHRITRGESSLPFTAHCLRHSWPAPPAIRHLGAPSLNFFVGQRQQGLCIALLLNSLDGSAFPFKLESEYDLLSRRSSLVGRLRQPQHTISQYRHELPKTPQVTAWASGATRTDA